MVLIIVLLVSVVAIAYSVRSLWQSTYAANSLFSFSNLFLLCLIYSTVLVAFGLSYFVFEEIGFPVLKEQGNTITVGSVEIVGICMYFSAITLLSVGYGDITPIGIGRGIAIIEALIGYTMPFAFVVRTVIEHEKRN